MERMKNFERIKNFFMERLSRINYEGVFGVARFNDVYNNLMPVQKEKLKEICGREFSEYMRDGSIICIGIAYPEYAINSIDVRLEDGRIDKDAWNVYAREYKKINSLLDDFSREIADAFGGIPVPATLEDVDVKDVKEYYGMTISHRVVAEHAGLGWRGKNDLIVNERFSCALRFASIITNIPLVSGKRVETTCGLCEACLEICSFLKNKDELEDWRENCRRYIRNLRRELGLEGDVCGRCIKACYKNSIYKDRFKLR